MNIYKAGIVAGLIATFAIGSPVDAQKLGTTGVKIASASPGARDVAAVNRAGVSSELKSAIQKGNADAAKAVLVKYGASSELAVAIGQISTLQVSSGAPRISGYVHPRCMESDMYPVYQWIYQNGFWVVIFEGCKVISN